MIDFVLTSTDRHFARFICDESGGGPPLLKLFASLVSSVVMSGHVCLDLEEITGRNILVDGEEKAIPPLEVLLETLAGQPVVGSPGDFRPLVLDRSGRLYLHRYWSYERELIDRILERCSTPSLPVDMALLRDGIGRLFPAGDGGIDWQKFAAIAALRRRFLVISGGPGTGKTSTVVRILALLLEQSKGKELRIAMSAPTGKAAARLSESIRSMKWGLECDDRTREMIPESVTTIHRLLGSMGRAGRFRYSGENRLPHDVVIVDEASMVPLTLMSRLVSSLGEECRLILLGDREQLASVEAGAVLGDLCGGTDDEPFSPDFCGFVQEMTGERVPMSTSVERSQPLMDSLVVLKRNYRFSVDSGVGSAAKAVRGGDGRAALAVFTGEAHPEMVWRRVPSPAAIKGELTGAVIDGYERVLKSSSPGDALATFESFRILCALRRGPFGVAAINELVEDILAGKGLIEPSAPWYHGRPVIVTANDYNQGLFNGDVGIAFTDPLGRVRLFFPAAGGGLRSFSPLRLPEHETAYAMTVHKSQGSEFEKALLLLPPTDSEVLTRELLYTAITRARSAVEIWGDEKVFAAAVERRTLRKSGLRDALWP